ncbi:NAD(P)-dependent oxidoreductase [Paenibacillus ihuae]|uniref:NAD(P)-dependent oxidoreductase n=1 Tax=Paenibacillus ihuae TaxID=1232431 RepID=UPI0006D55C32
MKKTAIFINGSRGATVDEEALVEALRSGTIREAGLDVYVQQPLPDHHPLTALDNAVLLPHIGSVLGRPGWKWPGRRQETWWPGLKARRRQT